MMKLLLLFYLVFYLQQIDFRLKIKKNPNYKFHELIKNELEC